MLLGKNLLIVIFVVLGIAASVFVFTGRQPSGTVDIIPSAPDASLATSSPVGGEGVPASEDFGDIEAGQVAQPFEAASDSEVATVVIPVAASSLSATGTESVSQPAFAPTRRRGNPPSRSSEAAADTTAPVISDITISTTTTTATISWNTDEAAESRVDYGTTTSYGAASSSAATVTGHSITLTGLSAETTYHARIRSTDVAGNAADSVDLVFATDWMDDVSLIDFDFEGDRYWFDGTEYGDESSALAAVGGVASGTTYTMGPVIGATIYTSDFSTGIDGWTEVQNPSNGDMSTSSGYLVTNSTGFYRISKQIAVDHRLAARITGSQVSRVGGSAVAVSGGSASGLASNGNNQASFSGSGTSTQSLIAGSGLSDLHVGLVLPAGTISGQWGPFIAEEVTPYDGFIPGNLSFEIDATMPAGSGNKVLAQWGVTDEDHRVRVVWDGDGRLRVVASVSGTDHANLDMGTVASSTRHTLLVSATTDGFYAVLDNGPVVADVLGTFPGVGLFWIGRSATGETWDGDIHRVTVFADAKNYNDLVDPHKAFRIYGDSTAAGTGASADWFDVLIEAYDPDKMYSNAGVGGNSSTQMLALVEADTTYRGWTTIFMDRPNTGELSSTWIANIKAAVALLDTDRWLVVPPAQDAPSSSDANISEVQALLLSDSFFDGHTFDASDQASYLEDLDDAGTRSDGLHFNDAGQAIQATAIKAWLDAAGW